MIPFLDLSAATAELAEEIRAAIDRVVGSGWYVLGDEVAAFEEEFAAACGAPACVGVGNGTDAVEIALRAAGVTAGDEVIVPSHTFAATWLAVRAIGAVPVPVEPRTAWSGIDPDAVAAAVGPRTAAVVPVHAYGHPADGAAVAEVARRHGLVVVEDAAQAHGARIDGDPLGRHADAVAYSFYPAKNLGALGDGGAVVTRHADIAARARALRNYGSAHRYAHDGYGRNSRLDELQAAVLRVKLPHLDAWNRRRALLADRYDSGLADLARSGLIHLPDRIGRRQPSWHLYAVLVEDRDRTRVLLERAGVQTHVHYPQPLHRAGAFADLRLDPCAFPVAERIAARTLSLPIGPHLPPAGADAVIGALSGILAAAPEVA